MKLRQLVIATALIICLALPAGAHAAAPRSFYGLIPATDPDSSEIARLLRRDWTANSHFYQLGVPADGVERST